MMWGGYVRTVVCWTAVAVAVAVPGCSSGTSKVNSPLADAEAKLEQSEAARNSLKGKPPAEAIEELDKIYDTVGQALAELTKLQDEKFSREEKARFERVLARFKERKAQLAEAKEEIIREVNRGKK